ncbi:MAG TPA: hypothetical protein VLF93_02660 [Candidatus Saccharimonadales bacterium]|nr:hypothetical protein [Candidatus Saccharimonadales bacterium]
MFRGLLSDFYQIIRPSYQPDTFQPYLLMTITIIVFTVVVYGFQLFMTNIHTYAQNPLTFHDSVLQSEDCKIFNGTTLKSLCRGLTDSDKISYKPQRLLSFEQDEQRAVK